MIFVDTSAIYALADLGDANHAAARARFESILAAGETLLSHNYVFLESFALLHRRLGLEAALRLAEDWRAFETHWIDRELQDEAVRSLGRSGRRHRSLVDELSFLVMRRRGVNTAFAFDDDFAAEGFTLFA
jgi:predicted nucleic acid-binding protein